MWLRNLYRKASTRHVRSQIFSFSASPFLTCHTQRGDISLFRHEQQQPHRYTTHSNYTDAAEEHLDPMNCLPRFCLACPLLPVPSSGRLNRVSWPCKMTGVAENRRMRMVSLKAVSDTTSSSGLSEPEVKKEKSDEYNTNMTEAMGAVLTYRHELGMNYNFIRPDLIVGSCLQTPKDVDKLRDVGVKTIFCLQQDPDLEYFGVEIKAIQEYAKLFDDIQHLRAEIRDFDGFNLRMRLPAVVSKLHKAINQNGVVTYVHCTAGLGRAPAVTLAYMFWIQGYKLSEAHKLLLSKRPCFPKLDAIKSATADILTGFKRKLISLTLEDDNFSAVEVSGLDIGWGQKLPLLLDEKRGLWILERELPEGTYEYKYVVDGEWTCNKNELVASPNSDGHVNNYIKVVCDDPASARGALRERLTSKDPDLTEDERLKIRQFLESYAESS